MATYEEICTLSFQLLTKTKELEEFEKILNNENRVAFAYGMLKKQKLLPSITIKKKTAEASISFRNLGNDALRKNEVYEAMQLYNLALNHAPIGSDVMALAVGNRSAVLCFLKYYNDCIADIDTVLNMPLKHTEDFSSKLSKRQKFCNNALAQQKFKKDTNNINKEHWDKFMKLKVPHNIIPCASSSVVIQSSPEMGRHIVACKDIKVGEVIAIEKPYVASLAPSHYLTRCYYCLKLCNNLMPCDNCCIVMFCSTECKGGAWLEYHNIECPLMVTLFALGFTKALHALRIVIKARNECASWEELIDKITEAESSLESDFRGHVKTKDEKYVYDSKYYQSIHTLSTNVDQKSMSDLYAKSVAAAIFIHLLSNCTNFLANSDQHHSLNSEDSILYFAGGLLLHQLMISTLNMHSLEVITESEDGEFVDSVKIGTASHAFLSLFNHSCAPNVYRINKCAESVMFAMRPIRKGMQLFDQYGFTYEQAPKEERQNILEFRYNFTCTCEACKDRWPLYRNLKQATKLSEYQIKIYSKNILNATTLQSLLSGDTSVAIKKFPQLCEAINAFQNKSPCVEIETYLKGYRHCIGLMSETVTRGYNRLYKWY